MTPRPSLKIELTPEQRQQIEQSTGRKLARVELKPEALECRATPKLVAN
jgi:hypothetical protein